MSRTDQEMGIEDESIIWDVGLFVVEVNTTTPGGGTALLPFARVTS